MCKCLVAFLAIVSLSSVAHSQEEEVVRCGPPPRFITVKSVDQAKAEVVFDVQVMSIGIHDQPTVIVYPDGHRLRTLRNRSTDEAQVPSYVNIGVLKGPWKNARWSSADGTQISAEAVAERLRPGAMVILSSDGAAVDAAYLRLLKDDTIVLVLPPDELPIPYSNSWYSNSGTETVIVKQVGND